MRFSLQSKWFSPCLVVLAIVFLPTFSARAADCPQCSGYEAWLQANGDACYYHGARLPSICDNDPECVRWRQECASQNEQLKSCLTQCELDAIPAGPSAAEGDCAAYEAWLQQNSGPCGYHGARLPSICSNDPVCTRWTEVCNLQSDLLQRCREREAREAQGPQPEAAETGVAETDRTEAEEPTHTDEWCRQKTKELVDWDPKNFPHGVIGWIVGEVGDAEIELCGGTRRPVEKRIPIMLGDCIRTGANGRVRVETVSELRRDYDRGGGPGTWSFGIGRNSEHCFDSWAPIVSDRHQGYTGPRIHSRLVPVVAAVQGAIRSISRAWSGQSRVRIRVGTHLASIGGRREDTDADPERTTYAYQTGPSVNDVVVDHQPDQDRADIYVAEGQVSLSDSRTGERRDLAKGSKVALRGGVMGPVQPMSQAEWDTLLSQRGLALETPGAPTAPAGEAVAAAEPGMRESGDATTDAGKPITAYLEPLRSQFARLQRLNALLDEMVNSGMIERMDSCKRDPAIDVAILGRNLHVQAKAFYDLLRDFRRSKTRRGLGEELDLIGRSGALIDDMLDKHSRLPGVKLPPIRDSEKERIRRAIRNAVFDFVESKLSRKLESKGLKDLLTSRSWQELREKAVFHVNRKVNEAIERETERIFGLRFHDGRSAQSALRRRARREVERAVGKLLIKITSNEILIEFAGGVIVRWLENDIWPKVRELFRPKGNLDERTARSVATLEDAALRLQRHQGDASLDAVRRSMQAAQATLHAARYLKRDIARANRTELDDRMKAAEAHLKNWMGLTNSRFLLDREEAIGSLDVMERVMSDAVSDLAAITGTNKDGSPGPASAFFVVKVAGSGFIPHWHGGSYEVEGSDQSIFELQRDDDLEGALSTYLASLVPDICEIETPFGFIEKQARPTVWNAGPELTVVCGPFFDRAHIDESMINNMWQDLRDDAPHLGELRKRAGCD